MTILKARVNLGKTERPVEHSCVALNRERRLDFLAVDFENVDAGRLLNIRLSE